MKFAKIFELEDGEQVLGHIFYDDVDDMYKITFITDINGGKAEMTHSFHEKKDAEAGLFEKMDLEFAQKFRNAILKMNVFETKS